MTPTESDRPDVAIRGTQVLRGLDLRFQDFEISWVGAYQPNGGLCFGSDDGRIKVTGADGRDGRTPVAIADSGEAINGVATAGQMMAVSTRCEMVLLDLNPDARGREPAKIYEGGAHGVVAAAGGLLAPLGPDGLLSMLPAYGPAHPMRVFEFLEMSINLVKVAHISGDAGADFFAGAARRDGVLSIRVGREGPIDFGNFAARDLDVVDVASLHSPGWPFAAVALGADGSFHFSRDLREAGPSRALRPGGLSGAAYTVLHSQGHLFLLTSQAFYTFPGLASRFLEGGPLDGPIRAHIWPIEAVDVSLAYDQVLVVIPDRVIAVPISELVEVRDAVPAIYLDSSSTPLPWNPPVMHRFRFAVA